MPSWKPTGAVMAAGNIGSATNPAPFSDWIGAIITPNHRFYAIESWFGPGAAHSGPYDDEGFASLSRANAGVAQSFTTADFSAPSGIVLTLDLVPNATAAKGSSVDFAAGPIIANSRFPLAIDGDLYHDGLLYDPDFDSSYPAYSAFSPPIVVDGASHVPLWFGENSSFVPSVRAEGSYVFKLTVLDASGAGWQVELSFTIANDCASCTGDGGSGDGGSGAGGSGAAGSDNSVAGVGSLSSDG